MLLLIILALVGLGCVETEEKNPIKETPEMTFLALGDSYTIGESVHPSLRWPVQLSDSLRSREVPLNHPRIIARTGWTTGDLLEAMDKRLEDEQFDLVSVLIGVNNQYQGKSIEEYEKDLGEIFDRAIKHSAQGAAGVIAVSIPDYGVTPFGAEKREQIATEIDHFNAVFKAVADQYAIAFYNITPISKRASQEKDLTASDELHPSGKMYSLWVEEIAGEVASKLEAFKKE